MSGNERLSESIQGAIGMIAFDENQQVIDAAGIGKERLGDIAQLSEIPVDGEGFGLAQQKGIEVTILKKDGKTLAIYNSTSS